MLAQGEVVDSCAEGSGYGLMVGGWGTESGGVVQVEVFATLLSVGSALVESPADLAGCITIGG